ncbi:MAG: MurR/RpiR family transcriptional regulator [Microbacteriaceae bacterium]
MPVTATTIAALIGERLDGLRPSERRVGRAMLADYPSAGLRTVASLADAAGVSAPSVVRFVQSLGLESFSALQAALRSELSQRSQGPISRVTWIPEEGSGAQQLVSRARQLALDAVSSLESIPPTEIEATIALLADTSRRLYLSGGRFSDVLARHLAGSLEQLRPRVRLVSDPFGADMIHVVDASARDVYVLIDFHRYQRSTVELGRRLRRCGATVILITDQRLSPAAADADIVLPISIAAPSPFYSLCAGVMLVELLVVPVFHRLGQKAEARMEKWDALRSAELRTLPDPESL